MSLDPTKVIHDALMKAESILSTNLTDPKATPRASEEPKSKFVATAYPERPTYYPHVILYAVGGRGDRICGNADFFEIDFLLSIDVLSKSTAELDGICDDVANQMRVNLASFRAYGMRAMRIPVFFRNNPMAIEGVHRKSAEYGFLIYVG